MNISCTSRFFPQEMKRTEIRHLYAEQIFAFTSFFHPVSIPLRPYYIGLKVTPLGRPLSSQFLHEIRKSKPINAKTYLITKFIWRYYSCLALIHTAWIVNMRKLQYIIYWFVWRSAEGSPEHWKCGQSRPLADFFMTLIFASKDLPSSQAKVITN